MRSNANAPKIGLCPEGVEVKIKTICDKGLVGLQSPKPFEGWSSLEGIVPRGCGYWASHDTVVELFDKMSSDFVIKGPAKFKKKSLDGMKCRPIASVGPGLYFVELEENVGGGSADGLGKKGHCVLVSTDHLTKSSPPKAKTKKK